MNDENKVEFIKVEVQGKDSLLWGNLQPKLMEAIHHFLDTVIDHKNDSTIREEAQKFTSALLDYGKQKLQKAGLENEKIIAEVNLMYSQREKEIAETRKLHAEAASIELNTSMKKLKLGLIGMKAMMIGNAGEEEFIFLKHIDEFISVIREIESEKLT